MELTAGHVWLMVAAALVLFMTPGLAFFYGGMTRAKAALNMMMMSFISIGIVSVVWVLWGYSMTGGDGFLQMVGNPFASFGLEGVNTAESPDGLILVGYGATFAIITVALISGAIADRAKFGAWSVFVPVWVTLVYCPLAYMVWGGGLFGEEGAIGKALGPAIDFAGGTVVHINAGVAALILVLIIGNRKGFGKDPNHRPHNIPFVMLGAAILWFGWFGFNGGLASSPEQGGLILVNTIAAPAAAMLGWLITERIRDGHPTSLGAASGVVAGLVAITPACANVSPVGALGLGVVAGVASALAVGLKFRWGFDDSLDVVGVHLVSGIIGTVALGFIALPEDGAGGGLFYGGGFAQLWAQLAAAGIAIAYSAVLTLIIALAIHKTMGFRVSQEQETVGVDLSLHAETAYEFGIGGHGGSFQPLHDLVTGKTQQEAAAQPAPAAEQTTSATGKESVGA
ncbi:ammonium transporter [Pseudarthrobacter enclensis]|uniref:Ammonium transporter n=1 Tax=Pseudarthrobacter enclensis TaxID=993070 RepID=A0A0V8IX02_9MICC|nr:ammonium transporter [Pseudarthrobacter enclensis]KSU79286.1 ammonia channel protein [Pseudarthrobacter enclensis]MBT2250132.1 ammonium transporter [Arthrobacter sp. BHU FT2]BCW19503.1 ammonium transporter [Arthrobacter sp. NtRootA9]SCB85778.1 ammonium transporter [Pseudarthrobacter enclensis]